MAKANREMEEDYIGDSEAKSGKRMAAEQVASLLKWEIADVYVKRYFDGEERIAVWEMANTLIREYEAMRRREKPESSKDVKARVDAARAVQTARLSGSGAACNAQIAPSQLAEFCRLDDAGEKLMKNAFQRMGLTARSHDRILRVARTIADLEGEPDIGAAHLAEAIQYRNTDILKG